MYREVTHTLMRNRLDALKSDFQTLQRQQPEGTEGRGAAGPSHRAAAAANGDGDRWSSDDEDGHALGAAPLGGDLVETERERQIRLGLITPFDNLGDLGRQVRAPLVAMPMNGVQVRANQSVIWSSGMQA